MVSQVGLIPGKTEPGEEEAKSLVQGQQTMPPYSWGVVGLLLQYSHSQASCPCPAPLGSTGSGQALLCHILVLQGPWKKVRRGQGGGSTGFRAQATGPTSFLSPSRTPGHMACRWLISWRPEPLQLQRSCTRSSTGDLACGSGTALPWDWAGALSGPSHRLSSDSVWPSGQPLVSHRSKDS